MDEYSSQTAKTYIYHSLDTILDANDILLDSISSTLGINHQFGFGNLANNYDLVNNGIIQGGLNYIIYNLDVDNEVEELDENNNIAYAVIDALPVYELPYIDDFEEDNPNVNSYVVGANPNCQTTYLRGVAEHQAISGAHSGQNCWYSNSNVNPNYCNEKIQFPHLNLVGENNVVNFFYKRSASADNHFVSLSTPQYNDNGISSYFEFAVPVIEPYGKGWKFSNTPIQESIGPEFRLSLSINVENNDGSIAIDDLYVGLDKADLLVQNHESIRYTTNSISTDTINYYVINAGGVISSSSTTKFYWSSDSIFDEDDIFLGDKMEQSLQGETYNYTNFTYSKINQNVGEYYIITMLDTDGNVDEMREYNNQHVFKFYQRPTYTAPYSNDFESNIDNWTQYSDYKNDPIFWDNITTELPGISGKVVGVDDEKIPIRDTRSRLQSPIFNLTNMTSPVLEFDLAVSIKNIFESIENSYSVVNMEFSEDGGVSWNMLKPTNDSYRRWYKKYLWEDVSGLDESFTSQFPLITIDNTLTGRFWPNNIYQSRNDDGSENCILDISHLKSNEAIQFRYNFGIDISDSIRIIYIDNFEISEAQVDLGLDYVKDLYISPNTSEIELDYHIRNRGNYISNPCMMRLFLSEDSLFDVSDVLIQDSIPLGEVDPDQRMWFFQLLEIPDGVLNGKNFLLFDIDYEDEIEEVNEDNNVSFYRLKPEGILNFPSLFNFNDYQLHGWRSNNIENDTYFYRGHRFTNKIYHREFVAAQNRFDGQMNLDRFWPVTIFGPITYLESPKFDLNQMDSVFISFNLSLVTNQTDPYDQEGANLEYSFDGGNNWNLLGEYQDPNGVNWYSSAQAGCLNNEPAWHNCDHNFNTVVYNATEIFAGHEDVSFRFKIRAKHVCFGPTGMKLDNFRISEEEPLTDFVAVNYGDTIDYQFVPFVANTDTVSAQVFSDSDLILSSNIDFRWSIDSIFDDSDDQAFFYFFNNAVPSEINTFSSLASYPHWTCDSVIYLVYRINSSFGPGVNLSQVYETDYSNNDGYFVVNLIDHEQLLPPTTLNFTEDQVICDGSSITLEPSVIDNYDNYNWSDGSDESTLTVTESGDYSLELTSYAGCVSETNTIHVDVLFNDVEILHEEYPTFCAGDSLMIYYTASGNSTWSNGSLNTSSIYATGAGLYTVNLISPEGCSSSDSILISMDFDIQPSMDLVGENHFCQDFALITGESNLFNYLWNTGDSSQTTVINEDGAYFFETENSCGTYLSDTLYAEFHNLIVDVEPGNMIASCIGDTINFNVVSSGSPDIDWHYSNPGEGAKLTIFDQDFNYPNGQIPANNDVSWNVFSADANFLTKLSIIDNELHAKPAGDSIVFQSKYIDVSNYLDIDLIVLLTNDYSDSMRIYYEIYGGPLIPFATNGSVGTVVNITAQQNIFEASVVRLSVVFDGISVDSDHSQILKDFRIRAYPKTAQGITLENGENYQYTVTGNELLAVEAYNEFCTELSLIAIEVNDQVFLETDLEVCAGVDQTICASIDNPDMLEVVWLPESAIVDVIDNCAILNTDENILLSATLMDGSPCPVMEHIQILTNSFENTISVIDNVLVAFAEGSYQWINCDNNLPIPGAIGQTYSPIESGNYAVATTIDGCTNTSDCVNFIIDNISEFRLLYGIMIYPNPTEGNIIISFSKNINYGEISIINGLGELIQFSRIKDANATTSYIEHLEAGVYYMKLKIDNMEEFFKVVKL